MLHYQNYTSLDHSKDKVTVIDMVHKKKDLKSENLNIWFLSHKSLKDKRLFVTLMDFLGNRIHLYILSLCICHSFTH